MAAIGFVNGAIETGFVGQLKTLSIRAAIEIRTNRSKAGDVQPDYRVYSEGVEIGAGWIRVGQVSGEPYVSLSLAAPEFGPRRRAGWRRRLRAHLEPRRLRRASTPRRGLRRGALPCLAFRQRCDSARGRRA